MGTASKRAGPKPRKPAKAAGARPQSKPLNRSLGAARATKQDEYYTQLRDIENELKHYTQHFAGKTVLCNCDDPKVSNFFHYFSRKLDDLKLKKVITTCYKNANPDLFSRNNDRRGVSLVYEGERTPGGRVPTAERIGINPLEGDGDFRSKECIALLKEADIVVTNPPFSLFREYVGQLAKHKKKFLVVGNINAITYKDCFELIRTNRMWLGYTCARHFKRPDGSLFESARSFWYTNLDTAARHEEFVLYASYSPERYPKYANFDAIEVGKAVEIPADYKGAMGVPVTFLDKYNPDQFEILGSSRTLGRPMSEIAKKGSYLQGGPRFYLPKGNGRYQRMYDRLVIRNKRL